MKIRFQADADLRRPIITGLKRREPTIDFQTAHEAGLAGLDDERVLAIAADAGRLLVSHDVSTMPEHFDSFIQTRISPGVILISQELPYGEAIESAIAALDSHRWRRLDQHNLLLAPLGKSGECLLLRTESSHSTVGAMPIALGRGRGRLCQTRPGARRRGGPDRLSSPDVVFDAGGVSLL